MKMTVEDLQNTLGQLLEQGIVKPDYVVAFTHQQQGESLKCYPIDAQKIAAIDAYPGSPKMLVLTANMKGMGDGR